MHGVESDLDRGRAAFQQRAWQTAHEALSAAHASGRIDAADVWRLALSAFLIAEHERFAALAREAHQIFLDEGDTGAAARAAFWLGLHLAERGDTAQASGWFGRAARVLEDLREGPERGYLLLPAGQRSLFSGDPETACRLAAEAATIGKQHGDRDLLALALHMHGRALLRLGRIDQGLALLDEAMVAVLADNLSPQVTGLIYCSVISACREVWSIGRAQEWTEALTRWCVQQPDMVAYTGECLVYRSEILRVRGSWQEAAGEARNASARFGQGSEPNAAGFAAYQIAEIHRLRGEFAAALDAYRAAGQAGYQPQPGLSLLRLAQDDAQSAAAGLRRALAETTQRFKRARLLPAYVEVMLAVNAIDDAKRGHAELEDIAVACASTMLEAWACQCRGAILLAEGRAAEAVAPLRRALEQWRIAPAPYDAARVHVLLSHACQLMADDDGAAMERDAARAGFEQLGAVADVARIDRARRSDPPPSHGLTPRECQVLALVATGRTNKAIAGTLSISEKTVARHVANIFQKLGVSSRSAATAYAWENHLADPST